MVKTIELMLGLPTLSLVDLIANDRRGRRTSVVWRVIRHYPEV
jgi:hypothetical protein